ncbi:DUF4184 family protein [Vallitalea okinawensis]|uniref:DUF4184 family protein n=1 Tax=Vallitalea okinawensis TaxID=2078660 RepID=UPI000CFD9A16|nr:DUF4184 family protein [Vallitalea okinawensis]
MPFTFAHPSVVIPLMKRSKYFNATSLVIGSMAPDFEYFIHFKPFGLHGHTLLGQLYFNLPLVLIITCLFHNLLKEEIIFNLPKSFSTKYSSFARQRWRIGSFKELVIFIYSALLGMATHILWDSFTHEGAYFVTVFSVLNKRISLLNFNVPVYKLLQHGSTIVGLVTLLLIFIFWRNDSAYIDSAERDRCSKLFFWCSNIILSGLIFIMFIIVWNDFSIGRLIITGINSCFISICIISLRYKINKKSFILSKK